MQWAKQHGWVSFFLFIFIHQLKLFFLLLCLDQWTQHDQTNIFFLLETPRGAPYAYFSSEKRPGYVANASGALLFQNCFMERPGGVYSVLYGIAQISGSRQSESDGCLEGSAGLPTPLLTCIGCAGVFSDHGRRENKMYGGQP